MSPTTKNSHKPILCIVASILLIVLDSVLLMMNAIGMGVFVAILLVSIIIIFLPIFFFKGTEVAIDDDSVTISAPFVDQRIRFDSIDSMSTTEAMRFGIRTFGFGGFGYGSGEFSNKTLGGYTLAAYYNVPLLIILTSKKKRIVFNLKTLEETEAVLGSLKERLGDGKTIDKIILGPDEKSGIERRNRLHIASVAIILVIILAFIAWTITIGSVDADLEDDRVSIDATMMHEDVLYDSITYVELRDDVSYGTKVGGLNNSKVLTGNFRNDEFGMYRLAVYNDVNQCIVIHTTEKTVVFNLDSDGKTRDMYNNLSDVLENPTAMHSTAMVPVAC